MLIVHAYYDKHHLRVSIKKIVQEEGRCLIGVEPLSCHLQTPSHKGHERLETNLKQGRHSWRTIL